MAGSIQQYPAPAGVDLTVPTADSTDNVDAIDVIGNKTDTANATVGATSSLMRYIKGILNSVRNTTSEKSSGTFTSGTSGSYSAYQVIQASIAAEARRVTIEVLPQPNVANTLNVIHLKLATGGAGAETDVAESIGWEDNITAGDIACLVAPRIVFTRIIAAGTRLSFAVAASSAQSANCIWKACVEEA